MARRPKARSNPDLESTSESNLNGSADEDRAPLSVSGITSLLDQTKIAVPLLEVINDKIRENRDDVIDIIIDANLLYPKGRNAARALLWKVFESLPGVIRTSEAKRRRGPTPVGDGADAQYIHRRKSEYSEQYLFGRLRASGIREFVRRVEAEAEGGPSALYRVWLDHEIGRLTTVSVSTVKADAARAAFNTLGRGIVWAVADTGVDETHPHFERFGNLKLSAPLTHRDFTGPGLEDDEASAARARTDANGHGTHVAGIIAGGFQATEARPIVAEVRRRDERGNVSLEKLDDIRSIGGMAPECGILSLKVLGDDGKGSTSNLIAALEYLHELNGNGRRIVVQGVNLSVGYDFDPKWFACGQSPLCLEVDRLVRSGVVVVVAAGNTGYGFNASAFEGTVAAGQALTINDPGNAELAITVGSTHREMPHTYGVSYFSSKGPTGDGRLKPDLVAPGEKIISCRSGSSGPAVADAAEEAGAVRYKEDSGTSMAAPHVSGVIAAFLSARREFIGRPEDVKRIFMASATDLKREAYFQGSGLVDLMRAIQSI